MTTEEQKAILSLLDLERQTVVYPGVTRIYDSSVIREMSVDGKNCDIIYSSSSSDEIDQVIQHQIETARREQYDLEWKVYGHDTPDCLGERLTAAGFTVGDKEMFMVLSANDDTLNRFGDCTGDVRQVTDKKTLEDVRTIIEEVHGESCDREIEQYGLMIENYPGNMSIYVAYVDGEPATCGRIYFHSDSKFGGLYGGQTRERFRKRGLFKQIVAARIREALSRGIVNICVDALPTSEPILRKRGFEIVTFTQPYFFSTEA